MIKLLHALAALLTVVLFLMRKHCVMARVPLTKLSSFESLPYDRSQTSMRVLHSAEDYKFCTRSATRAGAVTTSCSAMPKYKRDPDIQIDNEHIGVPPRG